MILLMGQTLSFFVGAGAGFGLAFAAWGFLAVVFLAGCFFVVAIVYSPCLTSGDVALASANV